MSFDEYRTAWEAGGSRRFSCQPKVQWVALYPPKPDGARWTYNVALEDRIGCGSLDDLATDASEDDALAAFRAVLRANFDAPPEFEFERGDDSWGATFDRP